MFADAEFAELFQSASPNRVHDECQPVKYSRAFHRSELNSLASRSIRYDHFIDLNGGASGSDATTAFTEQSIVSLFSSAALSANGGDSNSIDTVTLTLASATGTESLSLNAAASSAATSAGIAVNYNSGTGVLTLSGSNELTSDWQTILRGVQYDNTSDAPLGREP